MPVQIQDHVHIGTTLGADNAPFETYKAVQRDEQPTVYISVKRTRNGTLKNSVLRKDTGEVKRFEDRLFTLKLTWDEKETIKTMLGELVYVVDHYHPDAGENHNDYVKEMVMSRMETPVPFTTMQDRFTVLVGFTAKEPE